MVCTQRQAARTMGDVSAVNSISTTSAVDNGLSWSVRLCNKPHKLTRRGVPGYIVKLLSYWYAKQTMRVRWGDCISSPFRVSNGVRQGGILSPYLFNVYMDDLSRLLNCCNTGCMSGDTIINHLMYADDLVLISPSATGMK